MTQPSNGSIETISHRVDRLTIQIDDTFDGFRNRYERAVPEYEAARFDAFVEQGVDWHTVLEAFSAHALGVLLESPTSSTGLGARREVDPQRGHSFHPTSLRSRRHPLHAHPYHRTAGTQRSIRRRRRVIGSGQRLAVVLENPRREPDW